MDATTEVAFSFENVTSLSFWLSYLAESYRREPYHVLIEVACFVTIIYLISRKSYRPEKKLSVKEQDELIRDWKSEPLVPPLSEHRDEYKEFVVTSAAGATVTGEDGKDYLNLCSTNFLGLADTPSLKKACKDTIDKYGVGSCGPRGFYGSIDVHINLEKEIAKFCGTPAAIYYSDGIATLPSVIPAFLKRGDVILCDEGVNYAILQGISLSRSNVLFFKHNDVSDLERVLGLLCEKDERRASKKEHQRFIIVEGLYQNHGDICPLAQIVALKNQFKYRLLVDDSLALGVLGHTGRGSPEHHDISMRDIDLYCATLDTSFATVGGFSTSVDIETTEHQTLSGAGYCYSASAPPYCSTAGIHNIQALDARPELADKVKKVSLWFRAKLWEVEGAVLVGGMAIPSPVCHLRLQKPRGVDVDRSVLVDVREKLLQMGILSEVPFRIPLEKTPPAPSLRVSVTALHTQEQVEDAARKIGHAFRSVFHRRHPSLSLGSVSEVREGRGLSVDSRDSRDSSEH